MATSTPRIETDRVVEHYLYGSIENSQVTKTFTIRYTYDRSIKVRRSTPHERRDRLQMTAQVLERELYGYPADHAPGICADCTKRYAAGDLGEDLPL